VGEPVGLDGLVARAATATTLVLHEQAPLPLASVELPEDGDVLLVVGPEGGITERELAALTAAGATAVRLGASVLRTSTAGAAAAAVVSARTARWA
jgi:16S rRNA (uracil1498-N3)-methyltransferase